MMTAEMVGLPLAFIVLLLAQRSVLAAMMPMVLGMCAVGVTLGFTGNWNWWSHAAWAGCYRTPSRMSSRTRFTT